ncbi:MAG: hypothetical protein DI539_18840 [Flavobacterium psychrophilum]|nr:MAG: hypothetical protein DI539_18840 [Flavobacterium psychrophilum]
MKLHLLLSASLFIFFSKGLAQEKNCDVRQLQVSTYNFVLKNLDSIKKYTPKEGEITAVLDVTEAGAITKTGYFTAYGKKEQKEVKVWKGLETFVKDNFSRCPGSHFYNATAHLLQEVIPLPLTRDGITKAKKEVESAAGYIAEGTGKSDIPLNSKFKVEVKNFNVGIFRFHQTIEPVIKEGTMDAYRSKLVRLNDVFSIAFDVVKEGKDNYLKYTLYERVDNKSQTVTKEGWRPIVNNKVVLSIKGVRDSHPGVRHINEGEEFEFNCEISFPK